MSSNAANTELLTLFEVLGDDVERCRTRLAAADESFDRRQLVRSVFAMHDGIAYALKQVAVALHHEGEHEFTPGELSLLSEITYDLDNIGRVSGRAANLKMLPNLRFAFAVYAAANKAAFELNVGDHRWERMQHAVKVRNRLTHPKAVTDLEVTNEELEEVIAANEWFVEQILALMISVNHALKSETTRLESELASLEARRAAAVAERDVLLAEIEAQEEGSL